ncbi:hypothetical protein RJ640_009476 [Escallonia rubra]|uniref:FAD dependent oxidoreductase domain-containing protein n=1 Tax=Escallonia rubra TaxID=112253 RepID=A0AA88UTE4_9ASTE|nr:hypothetical protein RJ640_009476 [Escallonia rubra]
MQPRKVVESPATLSGVRRLHIRSTASPASTSCLSKRPLSLRCVRALVKSLKPFYLLLLRLNVKNIFLQHSPKDLHLCIDIYDEFGIGGGASGVSGGLLHPYSPKVKPLWGAVECWQESLRLLSIAEAAVASKEFNLGSQEIAQISNGFIVRRRGILRPAVSLKNMNTLNDNAQNCLASCRIESIDRDTAQNLVPNLSVPFNSAFYMPGAVNVHPQRYLEALYLACEILLEDKSNSGVEGKELHFHKKCVNNLLELAEEYDAVIICLGARSAFLPELSGRLPLRTCRGIIAHLELPDHIREEYPEHGPSILSDAWLAVQGPRNIHIGSTWEWRSRNYSRDVPTEEASKALEELLPKASATYTSIQNWKFCGATAGLRAMPPLTSHGSLPLLGCIDDLAGENHACKFWLFTGLGSRGLLYHGWLGKLTAQAVLSCNEDVIPPELTAWKGTIK